MNPSHPRRSFHSRSIKEFVGSWRRLKGDFKSIILLCFAPLLIIRPDDGLAEQFEVHGTITYSMFTKGENFVAPGITPNFTNTYSICVNEDRYNIRVTSSGGHTYECGCDRYLYRLIGIKGTSDTTYGAVIEESTIPPDDGTTINYIWLAYASAPYFSQLKTNRLTPIWLLDDPDLLSQNYTVPGIWKTLSSRLPLPESDIYLSDGIHRARGEGNKTMNFRYPEPFSNGFTNAEFRVLAITNIEGVLLPTRFVFERYCIEGNERYTGTVSEGIADVVRVGPINSDFRPHFAGSVLTIDKSFSHEDKPVKILRYFVTNGIWPEKEALKQRYEAKLKNDIAGRK